MLGILLIDKPNGITSHDVVNQMRRKFGIRRVGHAGTLDPTATGLLVVAIGPATRFLQYLPLEPKEYEAEITFGIETSTQDSEGEIVSQREVPPDLEQRLRDVLPQFKGLVKQIPPMHSAVKKEGKALYKYAREGKDVERNPRTIHIERISIQWVEGARARVVIICSGGTYIRTLAQDLGRAVGCGAYLSALRRTRVGKFSIDDAVALDKVSEQDLLSLREALPPIPLVSLSDHQASDIREGRTVNVLQGPAGDMAGLLSPEGAIIGVARVLGNVLQPECVIPSEISHGSI